MSVLVNVFAFLMAIFILVVIHEWGHFFVAKLLGIKVLRFSVGLGKVLWRRQGKDGTEYVLAALPLGGYVKMLDSREGPVAPEEKQLAFDHQPALVRIAVILAGPLVNILFTILVFWGAFSVGMEQLRPVVGEILPNTIAAQAGMKPGEKLQAVDADPVRGWSDALMRMMFHLGNTDVLNLTTQMPNNHSLQTYALHLDAWTLDSLKPDPLKSLGIKPLLPMIPPVIYSLQKGQAAEKAGLHEGDLILAVGNKPIKSWLEVLEIVQAHPADVLIFNIQRGNQQLVLPVKTAVKWGRAWKPIGFLGASSQAIEIPAAMKQKTQYPVWQALGPALQQTWLYLHFNFAILTKMLTGKLSMQTLGGPVAIYQSATIAFTQGIGVYIGFLAILSVMLAFVNLLPIPGLDGGHLLFCFIEIFRGKPIPLRVQELAFRIGLILLIVLMFQATINDLIRLFI